MSDTSAYVGDKLLNWIKGTAFGTAPATVYATLHSADPAGTSASEITGTLALTRQAITWSAVAARAMNNSADITFGTSSGSASVTYVAVYDSVTAGAGNEICKKLISTSSIVNGNVVKILATNLTLSY